MLTFIKAAKGTKLCMDKLYVTSILRIKVLSSFVSYVTGAREECNPKQQATAKFMSISLL